MATAIAAGASLLSLAAFEWGLHGPSQILLLIVSTVGNINNAAGTS
jgi:hypothetical protein